MQQSRIKNNISKMSKSNRTCCVVDCKKTRKDSEVKFYNFPLIGYKLPQREKWISAVRKANNSITWTPKRADRICSVHFIGNAKSDEQMSPSYAPTIFSSTKMSPVKMAKQTAALNRHARFMKRRREEIIEKLRAREESMKRKPPEQLIDTAVEDYNTIYLKTEQNIEVQKKPTLDQGCQVETFVESHELSKTLICNRYIYRSHGEAEIQTDIDIPGLAPPIKQELPETECNTEENFT